MAVHDGHRARKKEQFREYGLDPFADHEALELLLYYAIPRIDTNPAAHRLLDRFGTLDGVFSAPAEELEKVEGIGGNAATLLSLVFPLVRRARISASQSPVIFNTTEATGKFFTDLFFGLRDEHLYEACLDAKAKLLRCKLVAVGNVDMVSVNVRKIVEYAFQCNASAVVLAHNHPSGLALPSRDDNAITIVVRDALQSVGIELVDHIIVADDDFVSLRQNGLLRL